jgi:SHS2 domain-containing protein
MTELSIRPTAVYKTLDNRLIYSDANGLWEMGQGDSYKTYKYKTKRYVMDSHINYSAIKVHSNCDKVKVTVFTSRKKCQDKAHSFNLNAKAIHRLPALRAEEYQIQFEGTATVYGLELAPSVIDLGKS